MKNIKAFPVTWRNEKGELISEGMTLRDYFAGQALAQLGFIARNPVDYKKTAECCYGFADAMLYERELGEDKN